MEEKKQQAKIEKRQQFSSKCQEIVANLCEEMIELGFTAQETAVEIQKKQETFNTMLQGDTMKDLAPYKSKIFSLPKTVADDDEEEDTTDELMESIFKEVDSLEQQLYVDQEEEFLRMNNVLEVYD